ncbi:MAG: peptidase M14 [Gammaproteobacteria bacterium SG8_47]|nr:MAG: peptidase M14 [Gammaproteobacteria bacterium SG8_47]
MLTVLDSIPEGLLNTTAANLHRVLPGPTLIHLSGRRPEPLFVSVLLHGNEDTGWEAVRALLAEHAAELPRALSLFIGNVAAARQGLRHLPDQPDYNRIWRGDGTPEHALMREVVEQMRGRRPFASIDIHNNTGLNPHYACVNELAPPFFHLATLFSRTVVYFTRPDTVQSLAFAQLCPAVTVECGQPGQMRGVEHARKFVAAALQLAEIPQHPIAAHDMDLFHTVATVKIAEGVSIGCEGDVVDLQLLRDIDHLNFHELVAGTTIGFIGKGAVMPVVANDELGRDVTARYFRMESEQLRTSVPVMPSMLTCNLDIVRDDCLCYLMERYALEPREQ